MNVWQALGTHTHTHTHTHTETMIPTKSIMMRYLSFAASVCKKVCTQENNWTCFCDNKNNGRLFSGHSRERKKLWMYTHVIARAKNNKTIKASVENKRLSESSVNGLKAPYGQEDNWSPLTMSVQNEITVLLVIVSITLQYNSVCQRGPCWPWHFFSYIM